MAITLCIAIAVGLVGSTLTYLWFRISGEKHQDTDLSELLRQRRSAMEHAVQGSEQKNAGWKR